MLILLVSTVLLSGCGKTFLSRLFKSEHEEYAEILTAFLAAANQNDTKKIEELFAPNIRGKEFQKEVDDFLEFYNKTAKDGTWDKDDILLGVTGSQDRDLYRVMHSSIELKKDNKNYYIYMEVVTADKENPEDPSSWTTDGFVPTNEVKHPTSDWVETEKEVTVDGPEMAIEKTSDKNVYGVGETGHYTVKLSQTKENAEAKNVIIEDALQTEGAEILSDTIKVLDTKGTDITKSVQITTTKTSYTIKTGMNLAKDESFTVNYDVKFTSKSLVGKKVKNIAIGKADTGEVTTDHEVDVDKGTDPRLVVKKTSDKDSYKVGGQGQYTITVTNDRKGTVAKNVVIEDALKTTGTVIDEKSIKVTGPDGKEIEKATVKMTKTGFTVKTKSNLEGEKSMKVTYKVTFKDTSLAGKNVKNVATATSDNTKPGKSTKTVKVTKATPKKSTPKKSSGKSSGNSGSNGTSKTVKTSDIIFMVLIGAAVVFCVSGVVYVIKKRKRI